MFYFFLQNVPDEVAENIYPCRMKRKILIIAVLFMTGSLVAQNYSVDTSSSSIEWTGSKIVGGSHTGTIDFKSGSLTMNKGKLSGGEFVVNMKTIKEESSRLVEHLMSEDFFSVNKFPTASLEIKKIADAEDGMVNVTANLSIKEATESITFPAKVSVSSGKVKASAKLTFDRSKFDVRYGSGSFFEDLGDKAINDDVELKVTIVATK